MKNAKRETGKRVVDDPDFGPIEIPAPPSREAAEALVRAQKDAFARKQRLWPDGTVSDCPSCGKHAFVGQRDLSHEIARPGGVLIYRNLQGAKCAQCGAQVIEPWELLRIEDETGLAQVADYEAKVSNIGSGTVGTYWPKDVVRVMSLSPDTRAYIQIIDRETALIRFVRGRGGKKGSKPLIAAKSERSGRDPGRAKA